MERNALRYLVDALLYAQMMAVAAVGLLLAFVIPRGPGRDKIFLGLHRHDWIDIHLVLSLLLLAAVAVHLWFNRRWIVRVSRRLFDHRWPQALALLSCAWIGLLLIAWLIAWL